MRPNQGYDIIGDIHGHADPLCALLAKLGYEESEGCYRHAERIAVFVGDFIDRGPKIRETLNIVRAMVASGHGQAVLGNHEWNALRYHSTWSDGKPMRSHSPKNAKQHRATLEQLADPYVSEWREWLEWFRTLPLYLDLGGLRVVHAAWNSNALAVVNGRRFADHEFFHTASKVDSEENRAVRMLLNGPEVALPNGQIFMDKEGHPHEDIRARWFGRPHCPGVTYRDIVFPPSDDPPRAEVPLPLLNGIDHYGDTEAPVVFGHYWHPAVEPRILSKNAACVDYSVAGKAGGLLVAYRWDGERQMDNSKFVAVPSNANVQEESDRRGR